MEDYKKAKKVVIVTEASIIDDVTKMMIELGAGGYTIQHASGKGRRGRRRWYSLWDETLGNIKVEVIASEEVVRKIASEMVKRFCKTHAGIVYLQDVEVIEVGGFSLSE